MYDIFELQDGTYECHGRIQDGTERWNSRTIEEAISSMKSHAKTMNGSKIKKSDIKFYKSKIVTEVIWEEVKR